jgi:hypothetical protein
LHEAIAYANAHPEESKSIDKVRALIPKWISESKSQTLLLHSSDWQSGDFG